MSSSNQLTLPLENLQYKTVVLDFPGVAVDKNLSANSGDMSLTLDPGRLPMLQRLLTVPVTIVACTGFSSCVTRAYLLRSMWDLPRLEIEPMSPALVGRFLSTAPLGKSLKLGFS